MHDGNRRSYSPRPSHLRPPLTSAEQERLWGACSLQYFCERLVLALMLEMGLRPREVCALTFQDMQPRALSVLGEDGQMRMVPLGNVTKLALDRYVASSFSRGCRCQDEHASLIALDETSLAEQVRTLGKRAGLDRLLNVHDLRRAAILRARAVHRKEIHK